MNKKITAMIVATVAVFSIFTGCRKTENVSTSATDMKKVTISNLEKQTTTPEKKSTTSRQTATTSMKTETSRTTGESANDSTDKNDVNSPVMILKSKKEIADELKSDEPMLMEEDDITKDGVRYKVFSVKQSKDPASKLIGTFAVDVASRKVFRVNADGSFKEVK